VKLSFKQCLSTVTSYGKYVNMADAISPSTGASALFLRETELRRGIELLYFGYANMIRGADDLLRTRGLGRAHHRALYFIARRPDMPVSDLLRLLGITKQSLSRVLADLQQQGHVDLIVGDRDRRQRLLRLTGSGAALEAALFEELRDGMARAYSTAGQSAVTGFWTVLTGLIPAPDRPLIEALQQL